MITPADKPDYDKPVELSGWGTADQKYLVRGLERRGQYASHARDHRNFMQVVGDEMFCRVFPPDRSPFPVGIIRLRREAHCWILSISEEAPTEGYRFLYEDFEAALHAYETVDLNDEGSGPEGFVAWGPISSGTLARARR